MNITFTDSENARLRGDGCVREDRTGVPPLQAATEECSAN